MQNVTAFMSHRAMSDWADAGSKLAFTPHTRHNR
jgi:hypothetical protein